MRVRVRANAATAGANPVNQHQRGLGLDIGMQGFHLVGMASRGTIVLGQRRDPSPRRAFITTALVAAVHDATQGKNARPCAAWVGVAPRPNSPVGHSRLLGSNQRGTPSLRPLLGHGVRSGRRWVDRARSRMDRLG